MHIKSLEVLKQRQNPALEEAVLFFWSFQSALTKPQYERKLAELRAVNVKGAEYSDQVDQKYWTLYGFNEYYIIFYGRETSQAILDEKSRLLSPRHEEPLGAL